MAREYDDEPETPDETPEEIVLPIEDAIDLHPFRPRDIPSVVESYLEAAREAGFRQVRLIHGRGTGFQRQRVREVLERMPEVERFADAPPERGGWGATLVELSASARAAPDPLRFADAAPAVTPSPASNAPAGACRGKATSATGDAAARERPPGDEESE